MYKKRKPWVANISIARVIVRTAKNFNVNLVDFINYIFLLDIFG